MFQNEILFIETVAITEEQLMLVGQYVKEGALTQKILFRCSTYCDCQHFKSGQYGELEFSTYGKFLSH